MVPWNIVALAVLLCTDFEQAKRDAGAPDASYEGEDSRTKVHDDSQPPAKFATGELEDALGQAPGPGSDGG
jgi:hypothetical protein